MDILDSVRRAVRHYPGGVAAVSARLGKSAATLEKELAEAREARVEFEDIAYDVITERNSLTENLKLAVEALETYAQYPDTLQMCEVSGYLARLALSKIKGDAET